MWDSKKRSKILKGSETPFISRQSSGCIVLIPREQGDCMIDAGACNKVIIKGFSEGDFPVKRTSYDSV